jgi:hypothetical protein
LKLDLIGVRNPEQDLAEGQFAVEVRDDEGRDDEAADLGADCAHKPPCAEETSIHTMDKPVASRDNRDRRATRREGAMVGEAMAIQATTTGMRSSMREEEKVPYGLSADPRA